MQRRFRVLGFPIHPALTVFPLALLTTGVAFDVLHQLRTTELIGDRRYTGFWAVFAYWLIATGIVGGLVAAPFGLLDWLSFPRGTRAKVLGRWHGLGNTIVLAVFGVSWWLRRDDPENPGTIAFALGLLGLGLVVLTAWLGLEIADRFAVRSPTALEPPGPLLDFVFERHPSFAGRRVHAVWSELTTAAASDQVEFGRLSDEAVAAENDPSGERALAIERLERLGEQWAPFAGATWSSQPPRQVAAQRVLWEYFREQHPGGTMQMYDVWLADSELRRRGAPGFPRRAAATCGVLMALSALWGCGLIAVLAALLN